jgi:2-polyprenyl-3-methyl-5-hydroxy-6-metoxy-1,4-benzoquinol methylase
VICCEVLEHLDDPAAGLAELARVSARHVLLSTPWEPVWRLLNVARGRYLRDLGNTPGHVQHFSRRALRDLAATRLDTCARAPPPPLDGDLG